MLYELAIQCLSNIGILREYFLSKTVEDLDKNKDEFGIVVQWYKLMNGIWEKNYYFLKALEEKCEY